MALVAQVVWVALLGQRAVRALDLVGWRVVVHLQVRSRRRGRRRVRVRVREQQCVVCWQQRCAAAAGALTPKTS